jgi:hypothetical protein
MASAQTIRTLLGATTPWLQKKGSDSARLDAELMIGHALGLQRLQLYLDLDRPLSDAEVDRCRGLVRRRGDGEPVAYIVGEQGFYGLLLSVNSAVLVPRPETELLVELCLAAIPADVEGTFVDIGTGSGCIAVAILANRPLLRAVATDISAAAMGGSVPMEHLSTNVTSSRSCQTLPMWCAVRPTWLPMSRAMNRHWPSMAMVMASIIIDATYKTCCLEQPLAPSSVWRLASIKATRPSNSA